MASSSLLLDDPNLLFTVAGMVQFKDVFLRNIPKSHDRVVTIQKCLRVGGKHNDLDNVGFTKRHNTLFEMMGHFAFYDDDYSKFNIIKDAVDFLISVGLDLNKFWVTIDHNDEECYDIWCKIIYPKRIIKESSGENFWAMGDEGPCGFCTEILYDRHYDPNASVTQGDVLKDSERFLEVWNIVFMTKIRSNGIITDTPGLSIDTGMGLERLLSIIENVDNNFETSAFTPIIEKIKQFIPEGPDCIYKICADHIRSIVFLLAEGLQPSNEKQGYVLKKIIRRAVFYYKPHHETPMLWQLVSTVQDLMGDFYPEIKVSGLEKILYQEELKIIEHLNESENIIKKNLDESRRLDGEKMFFLYDTWGVNMAILEDYAQVNQIELDHVGFKQAMDQQKFQSGQKVILQDVLDETMFLGHKNHYDSQLNYGGTILGVYNIQGNPLEKPESRAIVVVDKTWFFPESCGQIGDTGLLVVGNQSFKVTNTLYYPTGRAKVIGHVIENPDLITIALDPCTLKVDYDRRIKIARNHTATHLLNQAFTDVIGLGLQKGSWIGPEKFRWDVAWSNPIGHGEILAMEQLINKKIQEKIPSIVKDLPMEEAIAENFCYLKNTFYEPVVKTINIGHWSKELCHGTHVENTEEIEFFKIIKKKSVSAGVIRFECATGNEHKKSSDPLDESIESKIVEPIQSIIKTDFFMGKVFVGLFEKVDLTLYDVYKNQYDFVILLAVNQGIIVGTETHRDHLPSLMDILEKQWAMKGSGQQRLYRGKLMDPVIWDQWL
jgi:alanyl-tRNA synthetase